MQIFVSALLNLIWAPRPLENSAQIRLAKSARYLRPAHLDVTVTFLAHFAAWSLGMHWSKMFIQTGLRSFRKLTETTGEYSVNLKQGNKSSINIGTRALIASIVCQMINTWWGCHDKQSSGERVSCLQWQRPGRNRQCDSDSPPCLASRHGPKTIAIPDGWWCVWIKWVAWHLNFLDKFVFHCHSKQSTG